MEPNTFCSFCNEEIFKNEKMMNKHKLHFCNKTCHQNYLRRNSKNIIVKCDNCKKEIIRNSRRRSKTGLFFCGNLCKNRFLAQKRRWMKDETFSHRSRKDILFKKSNFGCQRCLYSEDIRMLDIHHYDSNHDNNEIENLRILCVWCHNLYHRTKIKIEIPILITKKELNLKLEICKEKSLEKCKTSKGKGRKPKICLLCNNYFVPWNRKQKYCSNKCSALIARKVIRPKKEKLIELIQNNPMVKIGKMFDVSDNAVRKWAKRYEIDIKEVKMLVK
jgi:hypothetical protein